MKNTDPTPIADVTPATNPLAGVIITKPVIPTGKPVVSLVDVYSDPLATQTLFDLLAEREPHQSISHKAMPTFEAHMRFVASRPHLAWFLIRIDDGNASRTAPPQTVGAIYLSKQREVGLFVFKAHRGRGYGTAALAELRRLYPGRLLANVSPHNEPSGRFFQARGCRLVQLTYELPDA